MIKDVAIGDMVFLAEGQEGIGAVRSISGNSFVLFVENAGEFAIPGAAIVRVHDGKVVVNPAKLSRDVLQAIGHAHDREEPDLAG